MYPYEQIKNNYMPSTQLIRDNLDYLVDAFTEVLGEEWRDKSRVAILNSIFYFFPVWDQFDTCFYSRIMKYEVSACFLKQLFNSLHLETSSLPYGIDDWKKNRTHYPYNMDSLIDFFQQTSKVDISKIKTFINEKIRELHETAKGCPLYLNLYQLLDKLDGYYAEYESIINTIDHYQEQLRLEIKSIFVEEEKQMLQYFSSYFDSQTQQMLQQKDVDITKLECYPFFQLGFARYSDKSGVLVFPSSDSFVSLFDDVYSLEDISNSSSTCHVMEVVPNLFSQDDAFEEKVEKCRQLSQKILDYIEKLNPKLLQKKALEHFLDKQLEQDGVIDDVKPYREKWKKEGIPDADKMIMFKDYQTDNNYKVFSKDNLLLFFEEIAYQFPASCRQVIFDNQKTFSGIWYNPLHTTYGEKDNVLCHELTHAILEHKSGNALMIKDEYRMINEAMVDTIALKVENTLHQKGHFIFDTSYSKEYVQKNNIKKRGYSDIFPSVNPLLENYQKEILSLLRSEDVARKLNIHFGKINLDKLAMCANTLALQRRIVPSNCKLVLPKEQRDQVDKYISETMSNIEAYRSEHNRTLPSHKR